MLSKLSKNIVHQITFKNKIAKRISQLLTINAGAILRKTPTQKERKYVNVEITQDFRKLDQNRKKQRHQNMKRKQELLERKLNQENRLLKGEETKSIQQQLKQIKSNLQAYNSQIVQIDAKIEATDSDYVLLEGIDKAYVMVGITYHEYMHKHNMGATLHPQTLKAIENIHYCINHNLPLNRITLYEILPDFFDTEIGELDAATKRLISEKQLFIENEDDAATIRFFGKEIIENEDPLVELQTEEALTFQNSYNHCLDLLLKHEELLNNVYEGKTPFMNAGHLRSTLLSNLKINYLPEQLAFQKTLFEIERIASEWHNYKAYMDERKKEQFFSYRRPPPYIENHPVLKARYEFVMKKFQNPIQETDLYQIPARPSDIAQVQLLQKLTKELTRISEQKFDPMFVELMNKDRSLVDKKKMEIEFYQLATEAMQNIKALEDKSHEEEEVFKQLPKQTGLLTSPRKKNLLKLDDITRILFLNNKNKEKYNIEFFAKWFGVDASELRTALKYISYYRIPPQGEKGKLQDIVMDVLKMKM